MPARKKRGAAVSLRKLFIIKKYYKPRRLTNGARNASMIDTFEYRRKCRVRRRKTGGAENMGIGCKSRTVPPL